MEIDTNTAEVYFSCNPKIINKNDRKDTHALAHGWESYAGTIGELLKIIKAGVAYSACFNNGHRLKSNFAGSNIVSIDIDGTNTIDGTISHDFSQNYLTALYTTCSHTAEEHRFRLIFRLERVIESPEDYRNIIRALQIMYSGDRSAAEPARLFYGNDQASIQSWDRYIPNDIIDHLMKLNVEPEWDSINHQHDRASNRSEAKIPLDLIIKTSKGQQIRFGDAADRTPIFCPHHHDQNASAFVRIKENGSKFIHCVACHTTWFQVNPLIDYEPAIKIDFVETLRSVKNKNQQEIRQLLSMLPVDIEEDQINQANIIFMNQKHVDIESIKPGLTLIKSPKGSGKTHSLISVIRNVYFRNVGLTLDDFETDYDDEGPPPRWETGKTVLLVGHRQALIRSMCQRLDLNCYLDESSRVMGVNQRDFRKRYGVCLDSIKKVSSFESPIQKYDLVIIDEVEQVLAHLMASTSRDGAGYLETLKRVVAGAESVIAMDADLGWTSYLTLNSMRNMSVNQCVKHKNEIYINEFVAENHPIDIYDSKPQLIAQLLNDAQSGKKIFVSTNSKKQVNRLELAIKTKLPNIKLIAITSDNSNSTVINEFIRNIKTEAKKYDVVISSPSLGTGIDITFSENEEYYDSVYGIYEALINGHTEIDQQLSRVRHPKSVKVWVSPRRFNFETHFDVIKADLLCSNVIANTTVDFAVPLADQVFSENSEFLRTAALILSSQRESKNRLKHNFIEYKKSQGWIPNIVYAPDDQALGNEILHLGKRLEDQVYAERIINSIPIRESEYLRLEEALQDEERLSSDEFLSYQRMKLEIFYCRCVDLQMINEDKRWKLRKQFAMYNRLLDTDSMLDYQNQIRHIPTSHLRKKLSILVDEKYLPFLLKGILSSTPIFKNNAFITDSEFTSTDLKVFTRVCIKLKSIIERQFNINIRADITTKPVMQLGTFLDLIGIKTLKPRTQKTQNGGKTYFYQIDPSSVLRMQALLDLDEKRKKAWEFINNRYNFSQ